MNNNELVNLISDYRHNSVQKYSVDEAANVIRQGLIVANGGSDKITMRSLRDNPAMYSIIEDTITRISEDSLNANDFFNRFCEVRNVAEGDSIQFDVEADQNFVVADVARGTQALRRQRAGEYKRVTLNPTPKAIKLYEEWNRIMSGRADINDMSNKVAKSLEDARVMDVYECFFGLTSGILDGYNAASVAGTYAESELYALIEKVEAYNNGSGVYLLGTMSACRSIRASDGSNLGKDDIYNGGYATKWNGYDVFGVKQRFKTGTTTLAFPDKKIYVIPASMDKPIKQVFGGDTYLKVSDVGENMDLSIDVTAIQNWATGFVSGSYFGVYDFSNT